jgi:alkanesulfonate monooxygenase SsuD/methylene tetrahydromethanopterin reductase-like flavin-dependent oxidoreductase (luciferase family)
MAPRPRQHPHPPIWVGGNSRRAIRRAVELGDGWIPFLNPASSARQRRTPAIESIEDLRRRLDYGRTQAVAARRSQPLPVMLYPFAPIRPASAGESVDDAQVAAAGALAGIGVTEVGTRIGPFADCAEMVREIERLGEAVVPRIAAIAPGPGVATGPG